MYYESQDEPVTLPFSGPHDHPGASSSDLASVLSQHVSPSSELVSDSEGITTLTVLSVRLVLNSIVIFPNYVYYL